MTKQWKQQLTMNQQQQQNRRLSAFQPWFISMHIIIGDTRYKNGEEKRTEKGG